MGWREQLLTPAWRLPVIAVELALLAVLTAGVHWGAIGNMENNRRALTRIRRALGLQGEASDEAWSEGTGIKVTRNLCFASTFYFPIVQIADGLPLSSQAFFLVQTSIFLLFFRAEGKWYIQSVNLVGTWQILANLTMFSTPPPDRVFNRFFFFRSIQTLLQVEQFDIVLINYLMFVLAVASWRLEAGLSFFLPSYLVIVMSFTVSVLSIRGIIATKVAQSHEQWKVLALPCLPCLLMFICLVSPQDERKKIMLLVFALLLLTASLMTYKNAAWVDSKRAETLSVFNQASKEDLDRTLQSAMKPWIRTILVMILVHSVIRLGLPLAIQEFVLLLAAPLHIIATAWLSRSKSRVLAESFAMLAMTISFIRGNESAVLYVVWSSSVAFTAVMVLQALDDASGVVQIECNNEDFIAHRLKQKYVALSTAIMQAIEVCKVSGPEVQDTVMGILEQSLVEATYGHDLCYLSSMARRISSAGGKYRSPTAKQAGTLEIVGEAWRKRLPAHVELDILEPDDGDGTKYQLDWELLWLLVAKLSSQRQAKACRVTLSHASDGSRAVDVRITRPQGGSVLHRNGEIVLAHLNGKLVDDEVLRIPCRVMSVGGDEKSETSSVFAESLPSGLSFAVLDDNVLSRMFLKRFITRQYKPRTLVVMGASEEEANGFARLIVETQPDFVVFDQFLEYESHMLMGTEIALDARRLGFHGCAILHTANDSSLDNHTWYINEAEGGEKLSVFNGGVSKSFAGKGNLMQLAFAKAWRNMLQQQQHRKQLQQNNRAPPAPPDNDEDE